MKEEILKSLRTNSRLSILRLSNQISVPASTLSNRIKQLEKKKIIKKYTSIIDFERVGYYALAEIALKVEKKDRTKMKKFLMTNHNVNSLCEINSGFDFLIQTVHKDRVELKEFIENLEENFKIKEKHVFPIIKDIKRESFMANEETTL